MARVAASGRQSMGLFSPLKQLFGAFDRRPASPAQGSDLFRELAEQSSDVICRVGDNQAKYFSPACEKLFGWTSDEMMRLRPDEFFFAEDLGILAEGTDDLRSGRCEFRTCQVRVHHKDGSFRWVETNTRLARDRDGDAPADMIVVLRDITARKAHEDELAELALTDALTGIANRRAFEQAFARGWRDAVGARGALSLLLVDIDHFKRFNDRFGHQVGDDCLRAVAAALRGAADRPDSTVARFGGEEFAVILPGADADQALAAAEAARAAIVALAVPHPGGATADCVVTASIGAATALARSGAGAAMPGELLQAADTALYRAKDNGRNRVETSMILAGSGG